MKKLLPFLLFVCCFAFKTKAQTYVPFPDSGAMFINVNYQYSMVNGFPVVQYYGLEKYFLSGADTTINSLIYTKLLCLGCSATYMGAIRYTLGKVYIVPYDSVQEFLVCDFTAPKNTYLQNILVVDYGYFNILPQLYVANVDTVIINNVARRRLSFGSGTGFWIEGIGCTNGFLISPLGNISNYWNGLHCMTLNDTILYTKTPPAMLTGVLPSTCDSLLGLNDLFNTMPVSLYPNPATEHIHIYGLRNAEQTAVVLYDELGKEYIVPVKTAPAEIIIDLSQIPQGVYVLIIKNPEGIIRKKLIKTSQ